MDYWNRDEDGNAVRNTTFNTFKTKNGRTVKDGGGVMPDIEIASTKSNVLTDALVQQNVIFDYATDFYYKNSFESVGDFAFSNDNYAHFKTFAEKSGFNFKTETEQVLERSINKDDTLLGVEVQNTYKDLLLAINRGKVKSLDTYKIEISKKLTDEIVKRYFYREGLYDYNLEHDDAILTAVALLKNNQKYNAILQ